MGAIWYNIDNAQDKISEQYVDDPNLIYFDMLQEFGLNCGKLVRFQIDFNAEKVNY